MFKRIRSFIAFPTPASGDVHFTIGGGGGVCLYQGEDERYRRNLSVQLDKLNEAGYIEIEKGFAGKKPRTVCRITDKGRLAMEEYVNTLRQYINI
mgnify:CR=1 FL=1